MRHVNYQELAMMHKEVMEKGLPKIIQPKELCTGCLMSKQAKKHVPAQSSFNTKKILELVHADLCGPMTLETTSGNRYFFAASK